MPRKNTLVGMKFDRLTVVGLNGSKNGRRYWDCICDCGNTTVVSSNHLTCGQTTSCGCMKKGVNAIDVTGQRFGRLIAIEPTERRMGNSIIWKCKCDCGNFCEVALINLRKEHIKSCGCLSSEVHSEKIEKAKGVRDEYFIDGTDVRSLCKTKLLSNNTSGHTGVSYDRSVNLWKAEIRFKGCRFYLGGYRDKKNAVEARKIAEKEMHGNFLKWYSQEYPKQWNKIKDGYNIE